MFFSRNSGADVCKHVRTHVLRATIKSIQISTVHSDTAVVLRTGHRGNSSMQSYHNLIASHGEAQLCAVFGVGDNARLDLKVMDKVDGVTCERETGQYFPCKTDDENNDQDQRMEEHSRAKQMCTGTAGDSRDDSFEIFG